jgi:hypothetical protein
VWGLRFENPYRGSVFDQFVLKVAALLLQLLDLTINLIDSHLNGSVVSQFGCGKEAVANGGHNGLEGHDVSFGRGLIMSRVFHARKN